VVARCGPVRWRYDDRSKPPGAVLVPWLDGAMGAASYRASAELAPESEAMVRELFQLAPLVGDGSPAWQAHCRGWLRG